MGGDIPLAAVVRVDPVEPVDGEFVFPYARVLALELFQSPVVRALAPAERVLIAGAGGGFDVFAGLPLFFSLVEAGKTVSLANLSFTYLGGTTARPMQPALWVVDAESSGESRYFPERWLAEWLVQAGHPRVIYAFDKVGVRPLRAAYESLCRELDIDTVILVDGGTDILMRGDESGLGTPAEDMTSLAAVHGLDLPRKLVTCVGFGIDAFHGVCHAHFLENVAALERAGGYLGAHSLQLGEPAVARFRDAVEYVHARMPERQSIVNGSILSALEGRFGDYHRTERTRSSTLFINPLMTLCWHFQLDAVAAQSLYLQTLEHTETIFEVQALVEAFRKSVTPRQRAPIPV